MANDVIDPARTPVVILCGGQGTRIREVSESLPKPMIDVGGKPVLWHLMKIYAHHGFRRFVLCLGYKDWTIKQFFLNYRYQLSDFTMNLQDPGEPTFRGGFGAEDWEISLVYTGLETLTGGRLSRVREFLDEPHFCLTYGDGLADVDLTDLLRHHADSGLLGTVTTVRPTSRFGELRMEGPRVVSFAEKPELSEGHINGGFFVFRHDFLDYVDDDSGMLESNALQKLVADGQLGYQIHDGFWRGMDTYREYVELNNLWDRRDAPWRVWD